MQQQLANSCMSTGHRQAPAGKQMHSCQRQIQPQRRMATETSTSLEEDKAVEKEWSSTCGTRHRAAGRDACCLPVENVVKIDGWRVRGCGEQRITRLKRRELGKP